MRDMSGYESGSARAILVDPARGKIERADYLIDRFPVRYSYGGGWICSCADFTARDACKHTREAAGRRAAQAEIARHLRTGSPLNAVR